MSWAERWSSAARGCPCRRFWTICRMAFRWTSSSSFFPRSGGRTPLSFCGSSGTKADEGHLRRDAFRRLFGNFSPGTRSPIVQKQGWAESPTVSWCNDFSEDRPGPYLKDGAGCPQRASGFSPKKRVGDNTLHLDHIGFRGARRCSGLWACLPARWSVRCRP